MKPSDVSSLYVSHEAMNGLDLPIAWFKGLAWSPMVDSFLAMAHSAKGLLQQNIKEFLRAFDSLILLLADQNSIIFITVLGVVVEKEIKEAFYNINTIHKRHNDHSVSFLSTISFWYRLGCINQISK